ncbi:Na+/H+ antiporter NhaA [Pengzhenrongella frigida]|uniref:Na(+)/H(+) antiporter NhaA n=1 Tax=Pengzhenrongella frigida TaxID=1259133 RepID=A0A4Q5MZV3_9MICO|nr:Na+/H+ antiporter NhaA [Cellulomonas sp. HLT2-17]RYV51275.1 Na+/H+ antiporter NhaA [Cellulomonas sp. HLT2-17]
MAEGPPSSGRSDWGWRRETPLGRFLRTESGSAAVLLAATLAALVWANVAGASYQAVWRTVLSVQVGGSGVSMDLVAWVNSGLMTFFFFVVGLEARREFDVGELRERRRVLLPVTAGIAGMAVAVVLYLAVNAGEASAAGWGVAMSTDTAFALGMLALIGPRFPDRLRAFLLTVVVVDDVIALLVIATVYSEAIQVIPLVVAVALFGGIVILSRLHVRHGVVYLALGVVTWLALHDSGVDPIVIGLAMGLLTYAAPAGREDLERATDRFRDFREQPTPELARSARAGLQRAVSPNERLQDSFHPWTSYVIVPLFALANAGIPIEGEFLARAFRSPITLGIIVAYVLGKPLGILAGSWLVARASRGRLRPPVGWAAVAGGGTIAGIGFTVSLLIATLAFSGNDLEEAKLGILTAALGAAGITWALFRITAALPVARRARALLGTAEQIVDLADPVHPDLDHVRGPSQAPVTLVEYGDFECPYCGQAEPVVRELLADFGDIRYVWRHLPLLDVHPHAQLAAEASEAAATQGAFWAMHDLLLGHQGALLVRDLVGYAEQLGLDVARFTADLARHAGAPRVARDVDGADRSGVSGTPTFFLNGRRHHGAFDLATLSDAVRVARATAGITS